MSNGLSIGQTNSMTKDQMFSAKNRMILSKPKLKLVRWRKLIPESKPQKTVDFFLPYLLKRFRQRRRRRWRRQRRRQRWRRTTFYLNEAIKLMVSLNVPHIKSISLPSPALKCQNKNLPRQENVHFVNSTSQCAAPFVTSVDQYWSNICGVI